MYHARGASSTICCATVKTCPRVHSGVDRERQRAVDERRLEPRARPDGVGERERRASASASELAGALAAPVSRGRAAAKRPTLCRSPASSSASAAARPRGGTRPRRAAACARAATTRADPSRDGDRERPEPRTVRSYVSDPLEHRALGGQQPDEQRAGGDRVLAREGDERVAQAGVLAGRDKLGGALPAGGAAEARSAAAAASRLASSCADSSFARGVSAAAASDGSRARRSSSA